MTSYQEMLKNGFTNLPQGTATRERFEIPKVKGHVQGNKTIIKNMNQIITTLRRKPEHVTKFLLKELATPGRWNGPRFSFARKLTGTLINTKIKKYADTYVLCYECQKPDTTIVGENKLKCAACGTTSTIKG